MLFQRIEGQDLGFLQFAPGAHPAHYRFDAYVLRREADPAFVDRGDRPPRLLEKLGIAERRIAVADEGPGLPPGREERLFEKFERGRKEDAIPGVGLGLAICKAML